MTIEIPQRLLMGPGPSNVSEHVLASLSWPTIGHLDPVFSKLMDEIKARLQRAFMTGNRLTFPVSAPGSAAMEMGLVNLLEPGDRIVVCSNGVFGKRMCEIARRCGADVIEIEQQWGRAVDPNALADTLKTNVRVKVVAFVHAETSTGALSDAQALCQIAKSSGALTLVDAVTSLGGVPLLADEWMFDFVYSGTQKCLSCPPGLAPVSISDAAMKKIGSRSSPVQSWFMDINLINQYWSPDSNRTYHHTAPVNALYGLYTALGLLLDEGLEAAWDRHQRCHKRLAAGLSRLGMNFYVAAERERLPQLNAVTVPQGVDEAKARARLLNEFGIEIGGGLGPLAGRVWRIGLMGHTCQEEHVERLLSALAEVVS